MSFNNDDARRVQLYLNYEYSMRSQIENHLDALAKRYANDSNFVLEVREILEKLDANEASISRERTTSEPKQSFAIEGEYRVTYSDRVSKLDCLQAEKNDLLVRLSQYIGLYYQSTQAKILSS